MSDESVAVQAREIEMRVLAVEKDIGSVKDAFTREIVAVRGDFEAVVEKHSNILERIADKIETALNYQRDSLPVGLVMKLFTFFSVLVIVLLSSILGIKWVSNHVFEDEPKKVIVEEQSK